MSGGHWNYQDSNLKNTIFDWEDKPRNVLEDIELSRLLWDILELLHDYDWYISGDTGREDWLKAKREFKDKWLKAKRSDRIKSLIEERLKEVKEELVETIDG